MAYVENITPDQILDQLEQWYHIANDPNLDGYTAQRCQQKIQRVQQAAEHFLERTPVFAEGVPE